MREFPPDTILTLDLPGGGGYFDPFTRDPAAVRDDVIDGLVSIESARSDYGVVLDPVTLELDEPATADERRR
jgi:N-methylhydantoinase B/oxoprolinase/acetone carboxylase alpha subunit